jgi:metaxin
MPSNSSSSSSTTSSSSWLQTPQPIRKLFAQFPLQTLPANPLPFRRPKKSSQKAPIFFTYSETIHETKPASFKCSYNPTCLKWETYLRSRRINIKIQPSNNHASPTGALPFLLLPEPEPTEGDEKQAKKRWTNKATLDIDGSGSSSGSGATFKTIPNAGIRAYADAQKYEFLSDNEQPPEPTAAETLRLEAYISLVDHRIRPAWLHSLYMTDNLYSLIVPLYVNQATSSLPVRMWQARQLRAAARAEILKLYPTLDEEVIYEAAADAFDALEELMDEKPHIDDESFYHLSGDHSTLLGGRSLSLLDASVVAYTRLLTDPRLGEELGGAWGASDDAQRLRRIMRQCPKLIAHVNRIFRDYWGDELGHHAP